MRKKQSLLPQLLCVILLSAILVVSSGCSKPEETYSFPNRNIQIISIELLHNRNTNGIGIDESNMVLVRTLSGNEIIEFMSACYELPTKRMGTPPCTGYGEYIAKIYYENGDIEIYSTYNIELIPKGNHAVGCGSHYFPVNCFNDVFAQYVDINQLVHPPRK